MYGIPLGTAEWICARFTWTMCLIPRSDEFECQGHQEQISSPMKMHCHIFAANVMQQQTGPLCHCRGERAGWSAQGARAKCDLRCGLRAVCFV